MHGIEQPRKRKAERFGRNEPILLRQNGSSHLAQLADISITGARLIDPDPPAVGSIVECQIDGRSIAAMVVRRSADGFAVRFEESMDTRVHAIMAFYAGEYVRAYRDVRAYEVRCAFDSGPHQRSELATNRRQVKYAGSDLLSGLARDLALRRFNEVTILPEKTRRLETS
jgi:hypothetical protein